MYYFCPNCWENIPEGEQVCPKCGFRLDDFTNYEYEEKLIAALRHPVPERRIMAAQVLGMRESQKAIPEFRKILSGDDTDYYFLRAVLYAVARIEHPQREMILKQACRHPSRLVSSLAKELLNRTSSNQPAVKWDRNTG